MNKEFKVKKTKKHVTFVLTFNVRQRVKQIYR